MSPKESQNIEWKESWRDEYIRWVCGFANAFFREGMIESWGRGIEKIRQECKAAGVPLPEYRTDASGLMVQFKAGILKEEKVTEKTLAKMSEGMSEEMSEAMSEAMSVKIIALLKSDGSLSSAALAMKISKTSRTVERVLRKLRESGIIERVGPKKGGHWVVKEQP